MEEEIEQKRQPCEVYSRVVGYIRPIEQWNPGKQSEFHDRTAFDFGGSRRQNLNQK